MSDFDFSTLITDRTAADATVLAEAQRAVNNGTATQAQVALAADVTAKGGYNYTDLNRVGAAMQYVSDRLTAVGYAPGIHPKTDWLESDCQNPASMGKYLADLSTLRSQLTLLATTPEVPGSMEKLSYVEANNIERILEDLELVIRQIVAGFSRSNAFTFWSGNRPLPAAKSDRGRTWAGLDAMQTGWRNWQVATWYLLLYGNLQAEGVVE